MASNLYRTAYESIDREKMLEVMLEMGIPEKLVKRMKMIFSKVKCRVKLETEVSDVFYTEKGQKQSDSLPCQLFNAALAMTISDSKRKMKFGE
ncbi:hypothetical protein CDAR_433801 [Caerostris darwini]|uniref:Reverse transcriptase domain-containing protein n=1 Tax=Caerostris darwini TaxID=1538125 RepID=A0AAV4STR4_9ARAC|nr:hypothetical protein CDAR_433801 [Caerostris darwini]